MITRQFNGAVQSALDKKLFKFVESSAPKTNTGEQVVRLTYAASPSALVDAFDELKDLSEEELNDPSIVEPVLIRLSFTNFESGCPDFPIDGSVLTDVVVQSVGTAWGKPYVVAKKAVIAQVDENGAITESATLTGK